MMNLQEILAHRRSVRHYDSSKPIDTTRVQQCLKLATLAPTSSNLQLWECYHITNRDMLKAMGPACLDQKAVITAQQLVVFVVRPDYVRSHAQAVMAFERDNIKRNSPVERQEKRIKDRELYYNKLIPFMYARGFGLLGILRKALGQCIGLFRPMMRQLSESDTRVVIHKSCALAAQTFMLAMSEEGYDTCPLEGFDSYRVKRILKLPHCAEINMVISCGIRKPEGIWGDRFRLPFEEIYHKID